VLIKSRRTIAVSVLALAVAGGSVAVVGVLNQSSGPTLVAPAAQPSAAGPAATASVPRGAGNADGQGSASTVAGSGAATAGSGQSLSRSAGQGDLGPLAAGSVPSDGAVPGASASIQAMAAARATTAALPHSPQLLADLKAASGSASGAAAGPAANGALAAPGAGTGQPDASGTAASAASSSASATAASSGATSSGTGTPAASAFGSQASGLSPAVAAVPGATAAHAVAGIDVANYQHPVTGAYPSGQPISWASVAKAGYRYAAVKATEGDYYVNPWAAKDLAGAKAAGLDVTPYHFAVPNVSSGTEQAQFAVEYSGYVTRARMLPLMLDIEYDPYVSTDHTNECYGLSKAQMTAWLSAFVVEARKLIGQYPLIYTTANWWDTCTGSTAFGNYPMWVAAYGYTSPPMPAGWHAYTFWQYTSSGSVPGVNSAGTTDIDHFSPGAVGLINPGTQSARAGAAVSLSAGSLGALAGETLKFSVSGLPPGVTLRAGGALAGTVAASDARTVTAAYKVTLTAKNASGAAGTVTFTWKVSPA
jgi:GH25 family lysozyme M1 (1,4-beta-N-acetylmuramidase)